jgi:hypothetical protein
MNHRIWTAFCLLLASCAIDSSESGTISTSSTNSGSNGDLPLPGDAFPVGAVSYFRKVSCPPDWEFYPAAHGRAIIAAKEGLPRGTLIGEPLVKGEEREHEHGINVVIEVPQTEIAGIEGGGNDGMTPAGIYSIAGVSAPASAGVPYLRMLTCKKRNEPPPNASALPARLQTYFDLDACPKGWKNATATEGRLIVGLPKGAPADLPFGGDSLSNPDERTHRHKIETSFVTNPHGVALVSGCCGKFGKNTTITVAGDTDEASVDVPMIALLHCEKE